MQPGEKVIFTAKPWAFCTESGGLLGIDEARITMTNRRIIADSGQGAWTIDIAEDVVDIRKRESGKFLKKEAYILVTLNRELAYGIGIQKLNGYQFHFRKKDLALYEEIVRHMM